MGDLSELQNEVLSWNDVPDPSNAKREAEIELRLTVLLEGLILSLSAGQEPYELLFAQLARECGEYKRLSLPTARLMARWVKGEWSPVDIERAGFNLLHFAAELAYPEILAAPVWALYHSNSPDMNLTYGGAPLRAALLNAMITNQPEDEAGEAEAQALWEDLLEGRTNVANLGVPGDGFKGYINMPRIATLPFQEKERVLGKALDRYLREARRANRLDLADRAIQTVTDLHPGLDRDFLLWEANDLRTAARMIEAAAQRAINDKCRDPEKRHQMMQHFRVALERNFISAVDRNLNSSALGNGIRTDLPMELKAIVGAATFTPKPIEGSLASFEKEMYAANA